jgi:hypothetical protein
MGCVEDRRSLNSSEIKCPSLDFQSPLVLDSMD